MEEFALIKSRVNLNRVNLGITLISDLKVVFNVTVNLLVMVQSLEAQYHR